MKKKSTLLILGFFVLTSFLIAQINQKTVAIDSVKIEKVDTVRIYKGKFKPFKTGAHASYYADKFHGRKTASGKLFDMNKLTAAHKKLPFGTIIKVTNEKNGKSVIVEINDRGPYVKGREIDLSRKAFFTIAGSRESGYIKATLEILQK